MKLSVFLILLAPLPAAAAPLTLDEALALAATRHPRLLAHEARAEAAAALVGQAGYLPNPTLDLKLENFAGTGAARGVDALEGTIEFSQAIERGGKRTRRTAAAEQDHATAAAETAVVRAEILGAAARAYIAAVVAGRRAAFAEELVTLARVTLDDAEKRRAAGETAATEPARARTALVTAQAEASRQAASFRLAQAALALHWGGEADVPAATTLAIPETAPTGTAWLAGLEAHPRLVLEEARVAGRRAGLELARTNAIPDIHVAGGLRYFREGSDAAFVAGLSVPLPVRHRNQGAIRAARQVLAGAEFDAAAAARELRAEITVVLHELSAAHAAARQLRRDALPAAGEAVVLARRAYAAGQATPLEVLEAERAHHGLRRELLDQEAAFAFALVRAEILADPSFPLTRQLVATP